MQQAHLLTRGAAPRQHCGLQPMVTLPEVVSSVLEVMFMPLQAAAEDWWQQAPQSRSAGRGRQDWRGLQVGPTLPPWPYLTPACKASSGSISPCFEAMRQRLMKQARCIQSLPAWAPSSAQTACDAVCSVEGAGAPRRCLSTHQDYQRRPQPPPAAREASPAASSILESAPAASPGGHQQPPGVPLAQDCGHLSAQQMQLLCI